MSSTRTLSFRPPILSTLRRIWTVIALIAVGSAIGFSQPPKESEAESPALEENTIYIPYEQLRDVFEREGRGVFLPYEQFQRLWNEAKNARKPVESERAPVDAILVSAESNATIENQLFVVRSKIVVELLRSGWQRIPLQLGDAAILSATIDQQPAKVVHDPNLGYSLLVKNDGSKTATVEIALEYAKAYEKLPGQNSVLIHVPQAPLNRWQIQVPDVGAKVQVEPMLASADKKPEAAETESPSKESGTEVVAFIGASPTIRVQWVPKSEGTSGMTPLAKVDVQQHTQVEDGVIRTTATLNFTIERSSLTKLQFALPAKHKVINVFDPNVRKWSMEQSDLGADQQKVAPNLVVELFEPARKNQVLTIELETPNQLSDKSEVSVVPILCLDATRQQGFVSVDAGEGLRLETVSRSGLMQIDTNELPTPRGPKASAFRFSSVPFELLLQVSKVKPKMRVSQMTEIVLEPHLLTLELATTHTIEDAGVFQLEFTVPSEFELVQVVGRSAANVEAASIESHRFADDKKERLIVLLNRKALGTIGVSIQLRKKLSDPNLSTPTDVSSRIAMPIPRASGEALNWLEGSVVVYAQTSLRVTPVEKSGVRDANSGEMRQVWGNGCVDRYSQVAEVVAYAHAMEPVQLAFDVERKRPFVTVRQLLHASVEPGTVKFVSSLFTNVQFSSIRALRLDVPESLAKEIRVESQGVRESVLVPAPADLAPGYVAWELTSDTPWIGERTIQLTWSKKMEGLDVGKSVEMEVPRLIPKGVDQTWGQIVFSRKESIDLQPVASAVSGLRPIDPRYDLMPNVSHPDAVRAFEYQGDWALKMAATRFALEQVKQTSIERAVVRAIVTRSNRVSMHASYRMRNASQRLGIKLPEGVEFDSQPLLIDGKSVSLERGDANQLFIPTAGYDPTQSHLVELKYMVPGDHNRIDLPIFTDAPAAQTVFLAVFMPKERLLLSSNGPWTEEFEFKRQLGARARPVPGQSLAALNEWVREGVAKNSNSELQADGVMYLYSALKPEDSPDGSLRLRALGETWFAMAVIALLLGVGIAFVKGSLRSKIIVVAALIACIAALGAFAPTFASQLSNWPTVVGSSLLAILWGTQSLLASRRLQPKAPVPVADSPNKTTSDLPEEQKVSGTANSSPLASDSQSTPAAEGGPEHE
jgi:hypothetical protein